MKKTILLLSLLATIGCHAQLPPTNHTVVLTWTQPAATSAWTGCTADAPCTYVLSRVVLASGTTACPATTGTAYTPLNSSAPATDLTYTDTSAAGLTVCYVAQTLQGTATSVASNSVGPLVVPASPIAPSLTPKVADNQPLLPLPSLPVAGPMLTASLGREAEK